MQQLQQVPETPRNSLQDQKVLQVHRKLRMLWCAEKTNYFFRSDLIDFRLTSFKSVRGEDFDRKGEFTDKTKPMDTTAVIVNAPVRRFSCPLYTFEHLSEQLASNRPNNYFYRDDSMNDTENVGHIAQSAAARDQLDRTQRNQRENLMMQDEQNNKNVCKNIEEHIRNKSKRLNTVEAYIQTSLVLVTEGHTSIDFDKDSGLVNPLFILKQGFYLDAEGKFTNENFFFPIVPIVTVDFIMFRVTLVAVETLLATTRFLNENTAVDELQCGSHINK